MMGKGRLNSTNKSKQQPKSKCHNVNNNTRVQKSSQFNDGMIQKELMRAKNINATIMILRNFLSDGDISSIQHLGPMGVYQNHDRSDELDFEHVVYRFETPLRDTNKELYDRLLNAMFMADIELWRGIPPQGHPDRNKLHPEVEFISYDADQCARRGGRPPYIGPHVDNASAVTLIGMLSQFHDDDNTIDNESGESSSYSKPTYKKVYHKYNNNNEDRGYTGGYNRFELGGTDFSKDAEDGGIAKGRYRETRLNKGDVLMFRGEMLEHSLTNVTSGLRQIIQIELCREKEGRH